MMALVLAEHADTSELDLWRVVKMLLIHDVVEIYAGDTWAYDEGGATTQQQKESLAAETLFGLLPDDQAREFLSLRREFEERSTAEAAFAASIDAFQPLSNHLLSGRAGDDDPAPSSEKVLERKAHIEHSSRLLWEMAKEMIQVSVERGCMKRRE